MRSSQYAIILLILLIPSIANAIDNKTAYPDNSSLLFKTDNFTTTDNLDNQTPKAKAHEEALNSCGLDQTTLTPYHKQYINITSENDAYFDGYVDRYYTAGNRIGYTSKEKDYFCENVQYSLDPEYKRSKLWWLGKISVLQKRRVTRWDIKLAQEMYSPRFKRTPVEGQPDYPYAGYLYLSFGIANRDADTEERIKLNIGVVGPASLAQYSQDIIHSAFGLGGRLPGWDSQIKNEPIVNLHYQITKRYYIFNTRYISADVLPSASAALGNAHINVGASMRLRIGYNLDVDFGVSKMNHAIDSSPPHSDKFSIYLFGGAGGQLVIKNIFISGNTFETGTGLEINRFIYELEAGVAMAIKGFRLNYAFSHRSKEFRRQSSDMNFASISVDIAF